jgi:hypothetical protein
MDLYDEDTGFTFQCVGINTAGKKMFINKLIKDCEEIISQYNSGVEVTFEMLTPFSENFSNVYRFCTDIEEGFQQKFLGYFVETNSRFVHRKSFNIYCYQPMVDGIEWLKQHKNNLEATSSHQPV